MTGRGVRILLALPAGLILGGALALGIGLGAQEMFRISDFEGAYAMALVFFWVPLGALFGALAGLVWALAWR